ncbi:MAG: hypothetical protein V4527_18100 [Pseudomonadota bacterium]
MTIVGIGSPPSSPRGLGKEIIQITADTTISANCADRLLQINSSSTVTLTLPRDLPAGFSFEWERYGSGAVIFAAASGATLNGANSNDRALARYSRGECTVTAQGGQGLSAVWSLTGSITDATGATSSTVAELNLLDNAVASVSWAVAAGAANVCVLTGTIKDAAGVTIAASRPLLIYISTAATGIGISGTSYSTGAAITTGTSVIALTASKAWLINTHTDGTFAISITATGKPATEYAVAINWTTGQLSISAASAALWG